MTAGLEAQLLVPELFRNIADQGLAKRRFLCGPVFQEGQVTMTVANGGVGKSSLCIAEAVSIAGGFYLFDDKPVDLKVWLINAEDDIDEMDRRISAACEVNILDRAALSYRLFVNAVTRSDIQILSRANIQDGSEAPIVQELIHHIDKNKIKIVIVDPFVSTHAVSENDNSAIDRVAKTWSKIAREAKCAVHLVHHARKNDPAGADADSARGAGALRDSVRYVRTLSMVERTAVPEDVRDTETTYVKIDVTKSNYSIPGPDQYFLIKNHILGNGDPVGVVTPCRDMTFAPLVRNKRSKSPQIKTSKRRTSPLTASEIGAIIRIAGDNDFAIAFSNPNWIGHEIVNALGLSRADHSWVQANLQKLIADNQLKMVKLPRSPGQVGANIEIVKPFGP